MPMRQPKPEGVRLSSRSKESKAPVSQGGLRAAMEGARALACKYARTLGSDFTDNRPLAIE